MKKIIALVLAMTLVFALAVSTAALKSPEPDEYFYINVNINGSGNAYAQPYRIEKGSEEPITLTAPEGDFVRWEISGDYKLVDGKLTDKVIKIIAYSDLTVDAVFADAGKKSDGGNESSTSPKTGDTVYYVIGMMALAMAAALVARKKIKA